VDDLDQTLAEVSAKSGLSAQETFGRLGGK